MLEKTRKVCMVEYTSQGTPADYKCDGCGVSGVKLWREQVLVATLTRLFCAKCAGKDQDRDISSINADGMMLTLWGAMTDQIGVLLPAIPVDGLDTFWSYTAVPSTGVSWWRNLPNA
jgi:hypothetical protein